MQRLSGRVAVVTGGANGIGLGSARRFVEEGMKVVIADVNEAELAGAAAELTNAGGDVIGHRTDVSDAAQVQALADAAVARFGAVHVLCNNAGVGGFQRFANTTAETWQWIMGVNLWGPIHGCRIFLPILSAQDEAHIVNTSSMSGFTYAPDHHPYNVTKAGVVALSEGLYREFRRDKSPIGISILCPGFVATRIADDERNAPAGQTAIGHGPRSRGFPPRGQGRACWGAIACRSGGQGRPRHSDRTLHIFTHPEWLGVIAQRSEDIVAGRPLADDFRCRHRLSAPSGR